MRKRVTWTFVALISMVAATSLQAQPAPKPSPSATASAFATLLERAKKGDTTLDFKELRMAYTETPEYNPYGFDRDSRNKMFAAISEREYTQVLEFAEKILARNSLDMNGQFGAWIGNREKGNTEKATRHEFLFKGLIGSVEKSGDGKSPETAFVVISTDEEYVLLNWRGLRPAGQSLIHQDGHSYDRMNTINSKTNETVAYYFNVDKPFNWLGKTIKK